MLNSQLGSAPKTVNAVFRTTTENKKLRKSFLMAAALYERRMPQVALVLSLRASSSLGLTGWHRQLRAGFTSRLPILAEVVRWDYFLL